MCQKMINELRFVYFLEILDGRLWRANEIVDIEFIIDIDKVIKKFEQKWERIKSIFSIL